MTAPEPTSLPPASAPPSSPIAPPLPGIRLGAILLAWILIPVTAWCLGATALCSPLSGTAVAASAGVALCAGLLAFGFRARFSPWGLTTFTVVWMVGSSLFMAPIPARLQCGAHSLIEGTRIRALAQAALNHRSNTGSLPPSIGLIALEHGVESMWDARTCKCTGPDDVRIGRFTVGDYQRGRVTLDDIRRDIATSPPGELEQLGRVTFWHNPSAWQAGIIVAWREPDYDEYDRPDVAFGDLAVWGLDRGKDVELVAESMAKARALGLEFPAELLEFLRRHGVDGSVSLQR